MAMYRKWVPAACCFTILAPLAGCTQLSEQERGQPLYGVKIVSTNARDVAMNRRAVYLSRVRSARTQYESWAQGHKEVLLLLKERPLTHKTFLKVCDSLPEGEGRAGIKKGTLSDPVATLEDLSDVRRFNFSWEVPLRAWRKGGEKYYLSMVPSQFEQAQSHNDYPLSTSMSSSKSSLTLWSSGKITEKTFVRNPSTQQGARAYLEEEKEVEPAFGFMR